MKKKKCLVAGNQVADGGPTAADQLVGDLVPVEGVLHPVAELHFVALV